MVEADSDMADKNITIINQVNQLEFLAHAVEVISNEWDIPFNIALNLNLVLEELVTNIIFYGYDNTDEHEIKIDLSYKNKMIKVQIEDDGRQFDPLQAPEPNTEEIVEDRKIGGLGIHFVRTLMDDINYQRLDNKNRLTLTKQII